MNYLKTLWGSSVKNNFQKLLSKEYTIEDEFNSKIKNIFIELHLKYPEHGFMKIYYKHENNII